MKLKTKKAASKRFKISGSGKILRKKSGMRHLLEHKKANRKRQKRRQAGISFSDIKKVKKMLPGL